MRLTISTFAGTRSRGNGFSSLPTGKLYRNEPPDGLPPPQKKTARNPAISFNRFCGNTVVFKSIVRQVDRGIDQPGKMYKLPFHQKKNTISKKTEKLNRLKNYTLTKGKTHKKNIFLVVKPLRSRYPPPIP